MPAAQRTPAIRVENSREAAAGSDWAGPTASQMPRGSCGRSGCATPQAKPLGDREQVVVQVPAAISQRHLIRGRQWLAFLLIGAMARSAKG
jgi:hypothetical protein